VHLISSALARGCYSRDQCSREKAIDAGTAQKAKAFIPGKTRMKAKVISTASKTVRRAGLILLFDGEVDQPSTQWLIATSTAKPISWLRASILASAFPLRKQWLDEACIPIQWRNRPRISRGSLHLAAIWGGALIGTARFKELRPKVEPPQEIGQKKVRKNRLDQSPIRT